MMKKLLILLVSLAGSLLVNAQTYNVTFSVDMNEAGASFSHANVNGNFNGWCGDCTIMTDIDDNGVWEITIPLEAGTYEYKFTYDGWTGQENFTPGPICTITTGDFTNRVLTVTEDVTLPTVCWQSCYACGEATPIHNVTFQVDMNEVSDPFTTPEVNGTFNNWCGACAQLTDGDADGIWEITIPLAEGNYQYKYAYDNWVNGGEALSPAGSCTVTIGANTNRYISVSSETVLPVVCYGSCAACGVVLLDQMDLPVTFEDDNVEYGVVGFGGAEASTIEVDPTDANNTVVKVIKSAAAQTWAGTTISTASGAGLANAVPFDATHTQMTLRVWSPDAGIVVRLKAEKFDIPEQSCETDAVTTVAGAWETLTFDFANEATGTAELNLSYNLNELSVFFNYGVDGATAGEKTYYFDDLMMGEATQPTTHDVTFRLDMSTVTDAFTTPEVNGTFNNWCGACAPMSDIDGDNIWELTIPLAQGTYEYKYAFDNWTNGGETLMAGGSCTTTGDFTNRLLEVSEDIVLPVVCYGSCNACEVVATTYDVTFQLDMNNVTDAFTTPEVNGTFNGWCGACAPMSDVNGDNIWELTIALEAGTYEFKYAYDNWANGGESLLSGSSCTITTDNFTNRLLEVTGDMVMPVVCYASCNACDVVATTYNVTFQLDMNNVTESFTTPEVNGSFNGFCGACAPMSDVDGDNIWELTIALEAGNYEYKYAYDNWANGGETLIAGSSCTVTNGDFVNRALTVSEDITLPVVCYGSCFGCAEPGLYNVLFQVDMNEVTETFTTPEVNGTFNNWCGNCAPMTDANNDGVWELIIPLAAGTYEYKFSYDAWAGQEELAPGGSCTITTNQFTNRALTVTGETTLPEVCWESCSACDNPQGPFNITFVVDMTQVAESFNTPEVNGTFNAWCGNCAAMSDANDDNIWEITIPLAADTFDYKFSYDAWTGQESLQEGSSCTATTDGFTNRRIIVTEAMVLDTVCWSSCSACTVGIEELPFNNSLSVYPNPAQDVLQLEFANAINENVSMNIIDSKGRIVIQKNAMIAQRYIINTEDLADGMYYINITTPKYTMNKTFIVRK